MEGEETVLDFRELLEEDIRKSRIYIWKKKGMWLISMAGLLLAAGALTAFLIFLIIK
jgi:hypothetical protein